MGWIGLQKRNRDVKGNSEGMSWPWEGNRGVQEDSHGISLPFEEE